jgi:transcription elongation factor
MEARSIADVQKTLSGLKGIKLSPQKTLEANLVPIEERIALLEMSYHPITIARGSWVRMKCKGRYRHDLGLIEDVSQELSSAGVRLVPRISLSRKFDRTRRPKPALFDAEAVKDRYGADNVQKRNRAWAFDKTLYIDGLLCRDYPLRQLSDHCVDATQEELDLFRLTRIEWIVEAANSMTVPIHLSDRIKVVAGAHRGLWGYVSDTQDDGTIAFAFDSTTPHLQVHAGEVCKFFHLGDFVESLCGEHRGVEGFIVEMGEIFAVIYVPNTNTQVRSNLHINIYGNDVFFAQIKVNLKHIDWKSTSERMWETTSNSLTETSLSTPGRDEIREKMYTGDTYKGMEVSIHEGDAKMHSGVVLGTRSKDGRLFVDVRTSTRTINTTFVLDVRSVKELK